MPDDVAIDKVQVLEKLGAKVERVRPASIVDQKQFVVSHRPFLLIATPTLHLTPEHGSAASIRIRQSGPDSRHIRSALLR